MNAQQRLQEVYNYCNTNASSIETRVKELEPKAKFSRQTLYNIESGATKSISSKVASYITLAFPEINFIWLTNGTGQMLASGISKFFDGIAEPEIKYNPSSEDLVKKAKDLKNGKQKNSSEGRVVADDELVPVKTYIIPIKGFAGLRKHFFADEYIEKTFEETVTYVHRSERVPKLLKIQVDGNSMLPKIEPSDYCYCEPIPQIDWIGYRFKTDKIYCFFHHLRGILFKRAENKPHDQIELTSDNEDKVEYPNETFDIGEFKKILIVRTIEKKV